MTPFERILVRIELDPWGAVYRGVIGFTLPWIFRAFLGSSGSSILTTAALFIGVLIALRIVPAVLRHTLPFSSEAKEIWAKRRALSKQYDSFAWQKLFWIGLGLLLNSAVGGPLQNGELLVMLFCLIGGGAGLIVWQRQRASTEQTQAVP